MFAFKCPGDHNHDQNKHFSLLGQLPVFPDKVHYDYEGNIFASGSHNLVCNIYMGSKVATLISAMERLITSARIAIPLTVASLKPLAAWSAIATALLTQQMLLLSSVRAVVTIINLSGGAS